MEEKPKIEGPAMLAMTAALKAPPQRISKIGNDITLPATFQLTHIVAAFLGSLLGLIFMLTFIAPFFRVTILNFLFSVFIGGFIGILTVTWSPIKGESFGKWLGLSLNAARTSKSVINGHHVKAYIGIAQINSTAAGAVRIFPGAVEVPAGSVDERGVLIDLIEKRKEKINLLDTKIVSLPTVYDGFDPVKPEINEFSEAIKRNTAHIKPIE